MRTCQGTKAQAGQDQGSHAAEEHSVLWDEHRDEAQHPDTDQILSGVREAEHDSREQDDRELTREARESILRLYDEYRPRLFRYLCSMQLKRDLAEDVIQETFMRLTIELIRGSGIDNLQGWIVRVAHNLAVNQRKKNGHAFVADDANAFALENRADPALGPDETYSRSEQATRMKAALATLKSRHRECFEMRMQGFAYKDIGLALGMSEQRAALVVKQVAVRLATICG